MEVLQQEPKRRNKIMCKNCRHDKQRCEPRIYDWYKGERCERCIKFDYDCSPPEKKERTKRKQKITEPSAVSEAQTNVFDGMAQRFNSDDRIFPSTGRAFPARDPNIEMAKQNGQLPVVSWFADTDNAPGEDVVAGDSDTPASEDFTQVGKSSEARARHLVAKLGTLLVVRILFEQDMLFLSQIEEWIGTSPYIDTCRAAFHDFIDRVMEESWKLAEKAKLIVLEKKHMGSYDKEAFLEDVGNLADKLHDFRRPSLPKCVERVDVPGEFFRSTRYHLQKAQKRKNIFSAAALMTKAAHNCTLDSSNLRRDSNATQVTNFQQASEDIRRVLSDMQLHDPEHDKMFFGPLNQHPNHRNACVYLPTHLASRNSTESILKQLWTESSASPWELDCFGRTTVHYAAYYACVMNLEAIFKHDMKLVTGLRPDRFGMSPLAIAACKNDLKSFRLLLKYGASLDAQVNGKSILALAARNNSIEIVKYILAMDRLPPSLYSELVEATERGHEEIVHLLMQKYNSMHKDDYSLQINHARDIAQTFGDHGLARTMALPCAIPNVNQAVISLQDLDHNNVVSDQAYHTGEQQYQVDDSQNSFFDELWGYSISPSAQTDRYMTAQSFDSMPFSACDVNWSDNQNQTPFGWVND